MRDLVRVEPVTASHRPADRLAGWVGLGWGGVG